MGTPAWGETLEGVAVGFSVTEAKAAPTRGLYPWRGVTSVTCAWALRGSSRSQ